MEISLLDRLTYLLSSTEDKIHLLEDIAFLLDQDMPASDIAIDLQKGSSFERIIGKNLERAIENSQTFDVVFEPLLSAITLQTLKAGINNGDSSQGFKDACEAMKLNEGLFGSLIRSYIVPILKILAVVLATGFAGEFIFSQLVEILPPKKWDFFSQFIYGYTTSIVEGWHKIIASTVGLILLTWFITVKVVGKPRKYIDKLPFFRQYRILNGGMMLSSLSTLLNADEPLLSSVQFLQNNSNHYMKYHLSLIENNINNSKGVLGKTLDTGMVNERDIHRLSRSIPDSEIGDRLMLSAQSHNTVLGRQITLLGNVNKYFFMFFFIASLLSMFGSVLLVALSIR